MTSRGLFVTGTDTGVGKTYVAVGLLRALTDAGVRCVGMKPVAAGVARDGINADVTALAAAGNVAAALPDRNPYSFADPVAPHLAAASTGRSIAMAVIGGAASRLRALADVVIVEGAGGALVPVDGRLDMLDVAQYLEMPVLVVVGMRLGCINHALLTAMAVRRRGLELRGWIANALPAPMDFAEANVRTLAARLGEPAAVVPSGTAARFGGDVLARLGLRG
ncbi:MAG: dethiobiotin synthase [Betaproteobacteria bacterium]